MGGQVTVAIVRALVLAGVMVGIVGRPVTAETLIEHSAESRLQLDFRVPDAALKNALPAGWEPVIATAGPAKDANLRLIFVDRVGITGPDGKPVGPGTNRMAILAIPVKQTATGITGQMIIGGLTEDPADAPGPFGVYIPATVHRMERSYKVGTVVRIEQGLDIMRNATINVGDRVRDFRYTVSGGKFAALFDGTKRVLSWDSIPWHNRSIYGP
jgi:hypothetical protein